MNRVLPSSIKYLVLAGSFFFAGLVMAALPHSVHAQQQPPYEMLVIGDSHISGQGLRPENKFYFLVKEWLQNDVFGSTRKVNLKVKAHAGSRIDLHKDDIEGMKKGGDDINQVHYTEANLSTPSILAQVDVARKEYETGESVNLVMLSGCITDVLVADIINPFYPEKKLRERISRFCGGSMGRLLEHVTKTFPNAQVVVVGYFPIVSSKSDVKVWTRYFLKIIDFPPKFQFVFNNVLTRPFLKLLRNKMAKRSRTWIKESNREMREAIAKINNGTGQPRVHFVESPITEEFSYGTKKSMLWEMGENHQPNDETYQRRLTGCKEVFSEMKYRHYGRFTTRMCELSSVAHPNVQGSRAFARAIKSELESSYLIAVQK